MLTAQPGPSNPTTDRIGDIDPRQKGVRQMDLKTYVNALRAVARQNLSADGVEKIDQYTREYLQPEITALEEVVEDLLRAIKTEANKNIQGEHWSLIEEYLKSCLQRLPSVFEPGL
jgi:hypothetical protein